MLLRAPSMTTRSTLCRCAGRYYPHDLLTVARRVPLTAITRRCALQPAHPGAPQIPFTLAPHGVPGVVPRRKARQRWLLDAEGATNPTLRSSAPTRKARHSQVRYCHAFAEGRQCRAGEHCQYPHITASEVERLARTHSRAAPSAAASDQGGGYLAELQAYVAKRQRSAVPGTDE